MMMTVKKMNMMILYGNLDKNATENSVAFYIYIIVFDLLADVLHLLTDVLYLLADNPQEARFTNGILASIT
jgi:hypothetical protein